jgi:hypothetical protein
VLGLLRVLAGVVEGVGRERLEIDVDLPARLVELFRVHVERAAEALCRALDLLERGIDQKRAEPCSLTVSDAELVARGSSLATGGATRAGAGSSPLPQPATTAVAKIVVAPSFQNFRIVIRRVLSRFHVFTSRAAGGGGGGR